MSDDRSLEYLTVKSLHLVEQGRLGEAESLLATVVKETPNSAIHWSLYAYVASCFGRKSEYDKALESAKKLAESNAVVHFNIGVAMKRIKDPSWKGMLKKAAKLDDGLKDQVKSAMKVDYPTPLIVYPTGSEELLAQIAEGEPSGPQLSKAKPVDHDVDVISGMIRKVRGRLLRDDVEERAGYLMGGVVVRLEDVTLEMRYGPESKGEIYPAGTMVTVTIEDGRVPRIIEITDNTEEPLEGPAYVEVPKFSYQARWPKMCCGCGETQLKQLKLQGVNWDAEFTLPKTEVVEVAVRRLNWKRIGAVALTYVIGTIFGVQPAVTSSFALEISSEIEDKYDYYLKELETLNEVKMHLSMNLYLCKECKKEKKDYGAYVSVTPREFDDGFPALIIEFGNEVFMRVFHDHNPGDIFATVTREKIQILS
ncbi:MAG: tetratricopeptide repeat protein [Candidatus Thorarchaeota archaeon]